MEKYKSIEEYLKASDSTREDMKDLILRSSLDLLGDCAHNFEGDAAMTERVAQPLIFFNDILDNVK